VHHPNDESQGQGKVHDIEEVVLREMVDVKPSDCKELINTFLSHDGEFYC
jgi:hypothetical protein